MKDLEKKYLSEVIDAKEWEKEFAPFDLVEMIAGVGAGKNHWVCELAKQQNNSVLFVTSRRITADMQSKKMKASRTIDWDKFKRHALGGKPMKGGKLLVSCTNARLASYNKVTVQGAAASRVFFHLKAEAVRMGEQMA